MRREFVQALVDLAADDERIVLLTGDLGFCRTRAVHGAVSRPLLQRRGGRTEHGRGGHRPGRGRIAPVRILDLHLRFDARDTSSSATVRYCTGSRSGSSVSARAWITGTTA